MKIKELYTLNDGLMVLADKELSAKVSYNVQKNLSKLDSELKTVRKTIDKLNEKYVDMEKAKDNESKLIKDNLKEGVTLEDYQKELDELMDQEVDIDFRKIHIDDLGDIKIKPLVLNQIEQIIIEE